MRFAWTSETRADALDLIGSVHPTSPLPPVTSGGRPRGLRVGRSRGLQPTPPPLSFGAAPEYGRSGQPFRSLGRTRHAARKSGAGAAKTETHRRCMCSSEHRSGDSVPASSGQSDPRPPVIPVGTTWWRVVCRAARQHARPKPSDVTCATPGRRHEVGACTSVRRLTPFHPRVSRVRHNSDRSGGAARGRSTFSGGWHRHATRTERRPIQRRGGDEFRPRSASVEPAEDPRGVHG